MVERDLSSHQTQPLKELVYLENFVLKKRHTPSPISRHLYQTIFCCLTHQTLDIASLYRLLLFLENLMLLDMLNEYLH